MSERKRGAADGTPAGARLSLGDRVTVALAGWLGPLLVRLLGSTWRVSEIRAEVIERAHDSGGPVMYTFWHGFLLPLAFIRRGRNIQVLTSLHKDGEIISRILVALGYGVARGSSTRGSARALMQMLSRAVDGLDLAITPDGPTGPAKSVKRGAFYLTEKSSASLIPMGVAASRARRLSSWDSFMIPLPFSRIVVVYDDPLEWDASAPFEEKVELLKGAMERVGREAERIVFGGR